MFANGPGDLGSIPGRVIPKTQKMVLDASLLNTQHYKVRIKGKVEQSREGVAPSPTPWCSSYRKGSLRVTLDYGRQLYLLIDTATISKNSRLIITERSDFHMVNISLCFTYTYSDIAFSRWYSFCFVFFFVLFFCYRTGLLISETCDLMRKWYHLG